MILKVALQQEGLALKHVFTFVGPDASSLYADSVVAEATQ